MFGEKVKELRVRSNMTQRDLARAIGVSTRSLINYETGRCYPRQASVTAKLEETLHVSTDYLLSDGEVGGTSSVSSRDVRDADRLVQELSAMFAGGGLSDEDRDAAMEAIQQAYWDGRRLSRGQREKKK